MQCLERIKKLLREFPSKIIRAYAECGKYVSNVRVKIITYGNKIEPDIKESRWFNLSDVKGLEPEYFSAHIRYLRSIETSGNALALNAISKAIHTDWTQYEGKKDIILLSSPIPSSILQMLSFLKIQQTYG